MPQVSDSEIVITGFEWVPPFAKGFVRDLRARWACEEGGIDYSTRLISAMKRPEWFYAEQPWGQVPVLQDGELTLFESGAILVHLGEKCGLLPASGQARADALSWTFAGLNSIEPTIFELSNVNTFSKGEEWADLRRPSLEENAAKRFDRLATAMEGREWLAGDFSIADITIATVLREADGNGLVQSRPVLSAYLDRAVSRPAFKAALDAQLADFDDTLAPQKTEA
ncbi:glutathione S-transferase family protein [Croceicoccus naphthovorans]|uniref:Glutathione S-transferase n=1 Tax=Croceicoccus naphthovorans TaxID=1348774 RepID=A0A0G3XDH8_9SPHN|nr:glutathione S-transferase family protein [Croceicoccus naphthovorans]AKM09242.1 glutathione S-transferase [Croceicoccus naphthovorans]MBB3990370.1 glutathione S-transferase [Croceicoccus naphthovorans]